MWMGGVPPLGYEVRERRLVINPTEAKTVHYIYERYLELGSVRQLSRELDERGILSKVRVDNLSTTASLEAACLSVERLKDYSRAKD